MSIGLDIGALNLIIASLIVVLFLQIGIIWGHVIIILCLSSIFTNQKAFWTTRLNPYQA